MQFSILPFCVRKLPAICGKAFLSLCVAVPVSSTNTFLNNCSCSHHTESRIIGYTSPVWFELWWLWSLLSSGMWYWMVQKEISCLPCRVKTFRRWYLCTELRGVRFMKTVMFTFTAMGT